jgi:peptide/nickel transport system substrate-binding protein
MAVKIVCPAAHKILAVNDPVLPRTWIEVIVVMNSAVDDRYADASASKATPWEAEMDSLMREQATAIADKDRKKKFDRVQQIICEQQPFIYLVNRDVLTAVSPAVVGAAPTVLNPQAFWNAEVLRLGPAPQLGAQK